MQSRQLVESLFDLAMKLEKPDRENFLDLVRQSNEELGRDLGSLVVTASAFGAMLDETNVVLRLFEKADNSTVDDEWEEPSDEADTVSQTAEFQGKEGNANLPETIGEYRVLRNLGAGGQGTIFLVQQSKPERKMALKLIHNSFLYDHMFIARFQREVQLLSTMNHPHIARIHEVGKSSEGRLYFTMEYVDGIVITDYCRRNKLDKEARLRLFCQVCEGIQHAHRKLVLHRDIKPQNVLVTETDGEPRVKIIDFGLAKPMDSADDFQTRAAWVGTPLYMGPELFSGSAPDICGDVYALGMLLYELITDQKAFDDRIMKLSGREMMEALRTEIPLPPGKQPGEGVGPVGDDLDQVVMKAIHKEPDLRYATVAKFREDCLNVLNHRPVNAKPPVWTYVLGKFIRRNKALVSVSLSTFFLLIGALLITMVARNQSDQASRRYERSFQTLESVLTAPSEQGVNTRVIDLLQTADVDFAHGFEGDPQLEAAIRTVWGNTYFAMNLYEKAREHLEAGIRLLETERGPRHPETLRARYYLGRVLMRLQDHDGARELLAQTYKSQKEVSGVVPETVETLSALMFQYFEEGKSDAVTAISRDVEAMIHEAPDSVAKAKCLNVLATTWSRYRGKDRSDVQALFEQALDIQKRMLGPEHSNTLATMSNLADYLRKKKVYDKAIAIYDEVIELRKKKLGAGHDRTLIAEQGLALCLLEVNRHEEARDIMAQVCEGFERNGAEMRSLKALRILIRITRKGDQAGEAVSLYQDLIRRYLQQAPESPEIHKVRHDLGNFLIKLGRFDEAHSSLVQALGGMEEAFGEMNFQVIITRMTLGQAAEGKGAFSEADRHYSDSINLLCRSRPNSVDLPYFRAIRAANLVNLERSEEAERRLLDALAQGGPRQPLILDLLERHHHQIGEPFR